MSPSELSPFDVNAFLAELRRVGCSLGEPFHYFSTTTSTNDEANRLARLGVAHGATCFADYQSNGRGRQGKHWFAQPNAQLLASVLLRDVHVANGAQLTLAVGAALHRALRSVLPPDVPLHVKWPNDIEANGRKLAGILTESQLGADAITTVVGFGVNVWEPPHVDDELMHPVALRSLGCDVQRELLLITLLTSIDEALTAFRASGLTSFVPYLNQYDALAGANVNVDGKQGRALGIDADGALLVGTPEGKIAVTSGTVERH